MDRKDSPKSRRRLPTPNTPIDLNSSAPVMTPVAPLNFYSPKASNTPPPLPTRPRSIGSAHTTYHPPPTPPPTYGSSGKSPFREPELVAEESISAEDDPIPELVPREQDTAPRSWTSGASSQWGGETWESDSNTWHKSSNWQAAAADSGWSGAYDPTADYTSFASKKVEIDGRNEDEEGNWWDAAVREKHARPGPGILPPRLTEMLHNSEHSLFSVSATPPDLKPHEAASSSFRASVDFSVTSSPSSSPASTNISSPPQIPPPPTPDDVRTAVPHPNAYYCRKHNGWVLLMWKSSSVVPPLAESFQRSSHCPLPDQARRKRTSSCVGEGEQPFGQANKTHHFHLYERAVDARKLNPPFRRSEWEKVDQIKQRRRKMAVVNLSEFDKDHMDVITDEKADDRREAEGDLLDLYMCCQCSVYCVASGVIPGIIPVKFVDEFTRDKMSHPSVGKSSEASALSGWETMITIIENRLWKGENRTLLVKGKGFSSKLGWTPTVRQMFEALGFEIRQVEHKSENPPSEDIAIVPPPTDVLTPEGRQNRAKLLRGWLEISAWATDFQRRFAPNLKGYNPRTLTVDLITAREMYQTGLGAHPDQIPRGLIPNALLEYQPVSEAWLGLGLTATSYSSELLAFAYMAQCRCDPAKTTDYFTHFYNIVKAMQDLGEIPPQDLQNLVLEERSRFRYTYEDLQTAAKNLGFGKEGQLGVEFEDDVPEDFIAEAWKDAVRRAWRDPQEASQLQRDANDAFRVLAEARGSEKLRKMWEEGRTRTMNPDRAYSTLEVPKEIADEMLLTVYAIRVQEQPSQDDKMREALSIIADIRDSERIRQFLNTGTDPGEIIVPIPQDLPRGLNQLGNTCYLNSLLQYFYTIKELRDAIAPMAQLDEKSLDDDKVTDDDLKRHRVGGRLVTRKEIVRSKKFINQLATLFWDLEHCDNAAVTPTLQLAKLALTTSRDEEEDEADKGGTDSSNDTDATLVEDGPVRSQSEKSPRSPTPSTRSILGKRLRDSQGQGSTMDIDNPASDSEKDKDGFVMVSSPTSPGYSTTPPPHEEASSSSKIVQNAPPISDQDDDIEMVDSPKAEKVVGPKPPPLPQRKNTESTMMFGKQHDVSECMDNCMFQIETALLKFNDMEMSQDDKTSVIKRLFYGKIRQRLATVSEDRRSRPSIHEKEDLFSHLPVNVTEDGVDIYDGLSQYFDDNVEYQGKKARMEVSLVDLPPLLQIQLQRVQFNRETLQPYKSQAYVKFGESLYMDRFLDSADPEKKARSKSIQAELRACRERIHVLSQGKHAPFDTALNATCNFLSKMEAIYLPEVDEELVSELSGEQGQVQAEVEELRTRAAKLKAELEAMWQGDSQAEYILSSVFIHRGSSPSWGHYFFYSRHLPEQPDSWFKYNDSEVTSVSKDDILADTTGSTANPYLLVFAKKGSEVVHTVKRFDPMNLEEADA